MDTVVEVRDEHGRVVKEGEGQVFIGERDLMGALTHARRSNCGDTKSCLSLGAGGEDRVCLLDDEEAVVPGTMRASGDWVSVEDKQLFYLGRRDRLIKRHGKRVNLDALQQV